MDAIFKINKVGVSSISILGLELDNSEYLEETGVLVSTRAYAFSHSITLNVLEYVTTTDKTMEYQLNLHNTDKIDESTFIMEKDGLIAVSHMIIPNEVWLNYVLANDLQALSRYNNIIYYDTPSGKFKQYIDNIGTPAIDVSVEEILKEEYLPNTYVTTVVKAEKNTFNMYFLKTLYNRLASKYFDITLRRPDITHETKKLKTELDYIFMCMKCIGFLIEDLQLYEAQNLLEDLDSLIARNKYANPLIKHGSY